MYKKQTRRHRGGVYIHTYLDVLKDAELLRLRILIAFSLCGRHSVRVWFLVCCHMGVPLCGSPPSHDHLSTMCMERRRGKIARVVRAEQLAGLGQFGTKPLAKGILSFARL